MSKDEMVLVVDAYMHVRATPEIMEAVNLLNKNRIEYIECEHSSDWKHKVYYWEEKDLPMTLKTITTPKDVVYDRVPVFADKLAGQTALKAIEKDS